MFTPPSLLTTSTQKDKKANEKKAEQQVDAKRIEFEQVNNGSTTDRAYLGIRSASIEVIKFHDKLYNEGEFELCLRRPKWKDVYNAHVTFTNPPTLLETLESVMFHLNIVTSSKGKYNQGRFAPLLQHFLGCTKERSVFLSDSDNYGRVSLSLLMLHSETLSYVDKLNFTMALFSLLPSILNVYKRPDVFKQAIKEINGIYTEATKRSSHSLFTIQGVAPTLKDTLLIGVLHDDDDLLQIVIQFRQALSFLQPHLTLIFRPFELKYEKDYAMVLVLSDVDSPELILPTHINDLWIYLRDKVTDERKLQYFFLQFDKNSTNTQVITNKKTGQVYNTYFLRTHRRCFQRSSAEEAVCALLNFLFMSIPASDSDTQTILLIEEKDKEVGFIQTSGAYNCLGRMMLQTNKVVNLRMKDEGLVTDHEKKSCILFYLNAQFIRFPFWPENNVLRLVYDTQAESVLHIIYFVAILNGMNDVRHRQQRRDVIKPINPVRISYAISEASATLFDTRLSDALEVLLVYCRKEEQPVLFLNKDFDGGGNQVYPVISPETMQMLIDRKGFIVFTYSIQGKLCLFYASGSHMDILVGTLKHSSPTTLEQFENCAKDVIRTAQEDEEVKFQPVSYLVEDANVNRHWESLCLLLNEISDPSFPIPSGDKTEENWKSVFYSYFRNLPILNSTVKLKIKEVIT